MADVDKAYRSLTVDGWGSQAATDVVVEALHNCSGLVVQQLANGRVSVSRSHRPRWRLFRRIEAGEIVIVDGPRGCVVTVPPVVGNDTVAALRDALTQPSAQALGSSDGFQSPSSTSTGDANGFDLDGRTIARSDSAVVDVAARAAPMAKLQFLDSTLSVVPGESLILGRDPSARQGARAQVVPGDASTVSKSHLRVGFDGAHVDVEDLHSKNGSSIEHQGQSRALIPGERAIATVGDRVEMGATSFIVAIDEPSATARSDGVV